MEATIKQAEDNVRNLIIKKSSYGHWIITCEFRGKRYSSITTNSMAVDDFNSEFGEKDEWNKNKRLQGYTYLCSEIIFKNDLK